MKHQKHSTELPSNAMTPICLAVRASIFGLSLACGAAQAAEIVVNSPLDDNGAGCTLREAIASANTVNQNNDCAVGSNSGTDTITFSNSLASNTITLSNGELIIGAGKDIDINASNISGGVTIDANFQSRLLNISNATVSIDSMTLTRGGVDGGEQSINAIETQDSSLTLSNSTLTNNQSGYSDGMFNANNSNISISDSSISNNSLNYSTLIEVRNANNVTLDNAVISGNRVPSSFVFLNTNNASMNNTSISDNTSLYGSAVTIRSYTSSNITNSTISDNTVRDAAINVFGSATITNSTVSGNTLPSSVRTTAAGGIRSRSGVINLINTTIANNSSPNIGLSSFSSTGRGSVTLTNSIISNAIGGTDCAISFDASFSDISSDSNSILEDGSCNTQARSIDPQLGPLADNGGPTLTHALLSGSPAVNTGDNVTCDASDQRGETRPLSAENPCDVGSFELLDEATATFVIPLPNGKSVIFDL